MTADFTVRAVPRFRRLARSLTRRHPEFADVYAEAVAVLRADPYNRGRTHQIKKLTDVKPGEAVARDEGRPEPKGSRRRTKGAG